jgi:hypothetical protein
MVFHAATWIDELTLFTFGGRDGQSQFFDDAKYRTISYQLCACACACAVMRMGAGCACECVRCRCVQLLATVLTLCVGQWCCRRR